MAFSSHPSQQPASLLRRDHAKFCCLGTSYRPEGIHILQDHALLLYGIGTAHADISRRIVQRAIDGSRQVIHAATAAAAQLHQARFDHSAQACPCLSLRPVQLFRDLVCGKLCLRTQLMKNLQVEQAHRTTRGLLMLKNDPGQSDIGVPEWDHSTNQPIRRLAVIGSVSTKSQQGGKHQADSAPAPLDDSRTAKCVGQYWASRLRDRQQVVQSDTRWKASGAGHLEAVVVDREPNRAYGRVITMNQRVRDNLACNDLRNCRDRNPKQPELQLLVTVPRRHSIEELLRSLQQGASGEIVDLYRKPVEQLKRDLMVRDMMTYRDLVAEQEDSAQRGPIDTIVSESQNTERAADFDIG